MGNLNNKVALVTGASGAIGNEIAVSLNNEGASIILAGTRKDVLEKVAKKKDEQAFDNILQRITITVGVMRSFLNKPKRRM